MAYTVCHSFNKDKFLAILKSYMIYLFYSFPNSKNIIFIYANCRYAITYTVAYNTVSTILVRCRGANSKAIVLV